jgi:hypothetical protein
MLDTVKVSIPLTRAQHHRIHKVAAGIDAWNWARQNQSTGELQVRVNQGIVRTDSESFHREIRVAFPPAWNREARLWVEYSIPKYWYGHNIHLLYDYLSGLQRLREQLMEQFGLKRSRFPKVDDWELWRLDCCYAFRFPTQLSAQQYLDSLKRQRFPRKQPHIYPTSIVFGGGTYSFKVYLKLPEFKVHDRKQLLKERASLEWVNHLEQLAEGVLRVEASFRRKYLQRAMKVTTVGDLRENVTRFEWDSHLLSVPGFDPDLSAIVVLAYHHPLVEEEEYQCRADETSLALANGVYMEAPDMKVDFGPLCYEHPAGGFTYRDMPQPLFRLRELLMRLLGGIQGMQTIDKVEAALLRHYKPVKAAKLAGFWLYVRQMGAEKAKNCFGKRSYYYQRKQLKDAGVGLLDAHENLIKVDAEFFRNFKLDIPSIYVTNRFDDFRDSDNVLNLLERKQANDETREA